MYKLPIRLDLLAAQARKEAISYDPVAHVVVRRILEIEYPSPEQPLRVMAAVSVFLSVIVCLLSMPGSDSTHDLIASFYQLSSYLPLWLSS